MSKPKLKYKSAPATANEKVRAYRISQFPRLGWMPDGPGYWINPRTKRRRDTNTVLEILDISRTFKAETEKAWKANNRDPRGGTRPKRKNNYHLDIITCFS